MTTALVELRAKETELVEEITRLLGGSAGIGEQLKAMYARWTELHAARYPGKYVFAWVKDAPQMKRLLVALGAEELAGRMATYLRDNDEYLRKARHPFGLFVAGVNRYVAEGKQAEELTLAERPADCKHTPPCRDDMEHTRKRSADMRNEAPF